MNDREQMKADVERIATLIPFDPDTREAWDRIRARLEELERMAARLGANIAAIKETP